MYGNSQRWSLAALNSECALNVIIITTISHQHHHYHQPLDCKRFSHLLLGRPIFITQFHTHKNAVASVTVSLLDLLPKGVLIVSKHAEAYLIY
jgi:hypothetical protein